MPRTRLGEALVRIEEISRRHGLRVANVFHAGDGNLHPLILYDGRVPGEHERAEEIAGEILRMCIAFGGSITGEHGVGMEKRAFLGEMLGDDVMACMKRLRRIVDPHEIANRGKVFAEGDGAGADDAWTAPAGEGGRHLARVRSDALRMVIGEQTTVIRATSVEDVQEAVRTHARLRPVAGRTKPALSAGAHQLIDVSALTGVIEYQAAECTFTARAATPIAEIERMLAADGLYLPFEPPLADAGATLGGTVAAGLSGPGRFRYGGVRDFLLGVQFVDGEARVLRGGGKVVKNAAGFSLQHAFLGSLGRLSVLTEVTFKVFPRAPAMLTVVMDFGTFARALDALVKLRRSTFELEAVDLLPPATLVVRLGGIDEMLKTRAAALVSFLMPGEINLLPRGGCRCGMAWRASLPVARWKRMRRW